jgi:AbrB family looped-hinge helix DNA binding protein
MSTVTSKGQALIPKHIRDLLGITPGKSEIDFIVVDGKVQLVNLSQEDPFKLIRGIKKEGLSTDEIMEMTRGR